MKPGYYPNGVNIGYSTVTMNPGTYYLAGGDFYAANAATITGTGVTIYLSPTATSNNATYPASTAAVSIQSATSVVCPRRQAEHIRDCSSMSIQATPGRSSSATTSKH